MFDYEAVKQFYFEKGHNDPAGKGRFESAFYHTIKMVHDTVREQTLAERADEVEAMKADIKTLCAALKTTSEGNAKLLAEAATKDHCTSCSNIGRVNGDSQETYCEQCIFQHTWRQDHYVPKERAGVRSE